MHALEDQKEAQRKLNEEELNLKMEVLRNESKAETEKIVSFFLFFLSFASVAAIIVHSSPPFSLLLWGMPPPLGYVFTLFNSFSLT